MRKTIPQILNESCPHPKHEAFGKPKRFCHPCMVIVAEKAGSINREVNSKSKYHNVITQEEWDTFVQIMEKCSTTSVTGCDNCLIKKGCQEVHDRLSGLCNTSVGHWANESVTSDNINPYVVGMDGTGFKVLIEKK